MKKLLIILSLTLGLMATESRINHALAAPGAAGFPDVIEGDKLRFGSMIVELFGIRAPKPGMICPGPDRLNSNAVRRRNRPLIASLKTMPSNVSKSPTPSFFPC